MLPCTPIKVLIVDDSALVRTILTRVLSAFDDIRVVGAAANPFDARELIIAHRPNVIILDIAMPRMDGLTFLRKLMVHYPVPVIMCSGVTNPSGEAAVTALEAGAVDVVIKPRAGSAAALQRLGTELAEKVRAAAVSCPVPPVIPAAATAEPRSFRAAGVDPASYVIAIGASTGGTEAIAALLRSAPADFPPVAIVQHMPEGFTCSFAQRLAQISRLNVREAVDGDVLVAGAALVARGGVQMTVRRQADRKTLHYGSSAPCNRHCPSVDVLFHSVAEQIGPRSVGILLTGMGADGATGLLHIRESGGRTFAQNKHSCVVYGMPKAAVELGAVEQTAAPGEIPNLVLNVLERPHARQGGTGKLVYPCGPSRNDRG